MRQMTEEQHKQRQRYRQREINKRWQWTALYLSVILGAMMQMLEKHLQLSHLFMLLPSSVVPVWQSVWISIVTFAWFSALLTRLWMRVYNYQRERLAAEQEALRKAATPTDGVWPPPPQSPV